MITDSLLTENDRKEKLSIAYASAVAAAAGYVTSQPNADRDSIDLEIAAGGSMRARIALQLKATSNPNWHEDDLHFVVKKKNYDDLIALRQVPLILVVMVLPASNQFWLRTSEEQLLLRHCAWWLSLKGFPEIDQDSKVVRMPKAQRFDASALKDLIDASRRGVL